MNKVFVIGVIVSIVIVLGVVGTFLYDDTSEDMNDVTINDVLDSESKHYSVSLTESAQVKTP